MYLVILCYLLQFFVVQMVTFGSSLGIFPHQTPPPRKLLHLPFCSLKTSIFICVFTLDLVKYCESMIAPCQIFSVLCQFVFPISPLQARTSGLGTFLDFSLRNLSFPFLLQIWTFIFAVSKAVTSPSLTVTPLSSQSQSARQELIQNAA